MIDLIQILGAFFLASVFDVALGGGGGFIIIPVMLLKGYEPTVIIASTWFAYLFAVMAGIHQLIRKDQFHFDWNITPFVVACSFGGIFGVYSALQIDPNILKQIIVYVIIFMLAVWSLPSKKVSFTLHPWVKYPLVFIGFFLTGAYEAMVGSGGGMLLTLLFVLLLGKGIKSTLGYRLIVSLMLGVIIISTYAFNGKFDLQIALLLSVVGLIGGYIGAHIFIKLPETILKVLFYGICFVTIGMLLTQ